MRSWSIKNSGKAFIDFMGFERHRCLCSRKPGYWPCGIPLAVGGMSAGVSCSEPHMTKIAGFTTDHQESVYQHLAGRRY